MSATGLYDKYDIKKKDGTPVDDDAVYFVLRLDTDPHARRAAEIYAAHCREDNPELAQDLLDLVLLHEIKD